MARSFYKFEVSDSAKAYEEICGILTQRGFKKTSAKKEEIWKWGTGLTCAPKYISIEIPEEHAIVIKAWVRSLVTGEMEIDSGFTAIIPKEQLKYVIRTIQESVI